MIAILRRKEIERRIAAVREGRIPALPDLRDVDLLSRFHDNLLFLCAYPPSPRVLRRAEALLRTFAKRFEDFPFLDPEYSGIAGTSLETTASYPIAKFLSEHADVTIDWENMPDDDRLAALLNPVVPYLAEVTLVDANVDMREWMDGKLRTLLKGDPQAFDALSPLLHWKFHNDALTRTRMRRRTGKVFYQTGPMLARRDITLARDLARPRLPVRKLPRREAEKALDMTRAALAMRGREVYAFTWGDPSAIVSAQCGRGVEILLIGILPEKRLPLRAGFAPIIFRNGVPIGYADAYGIADRMEVSFNIFYAFRDAEAAFVFARMLRLYRQMFGTNSFSVDPYQIGLGNYEAIDAGAFWFYRKLGFRSTEPAVERLAQREEARVAEDPGYRSSRATLLRLAKSSMIYDMPGAPQGAWDRFRMKTLLRNAQKIPKIARKSDAQYLRDGGRDEKFPRAVIRAGRTRRRTR